MLRNADYIYNNILKADEKNTTLKNCKLNEVGVDLSVKQILKIKSDSYGIILKDKTYAPEYEEIPLQQLDNKIKGWFLNKGTYILILNEGCNFGPKDTGLIIGRSSLNRSGCSIMSCVWDAGYSSINGTSIKPMSVRLNVDTDRVFIEKNARVAQLIIFENEDCELYSGQWQGGRMVSKLVEESQYESKRSNENIANN